MPLTHNSSSKILSDESMNAGSIVECFTCVNSLHPHCEANIIVPTLQMRTAKLREGEQLDQNHPFVTAGSQK